MNGIPFYVWMHAIRPGHDYMAWRRAVNAWLKVFDYEGGIGKADLVSAWNRRLTARDTVRCYGRPF